MKTRYRIERSATNFPYAFCRCLTDAIKVCDALSKTENESYHVIDTLCEDIKIYGNKKTQML